jgi:hypothetical protein
MNKGAFLIAHNNNLVDYVKQAVYNAERIKSFLDIPVSIATSNADYLRENFNSNIFDKIIEVDTVDENNTRVIFDGYNNKKTISWKNYNRCSVYDLTPYDETLLLDTDLVICNSLLKQCFDSQQDFLVYRTAEDLTGNSDVDEFKFISETSIDFYWATVVFFRKTKANKIFFDLVKHIQEEWTHYKNLYQIKSTTFRNDYAFSIAIHMMNGFQHGTFASLLPGKLHYVSDKSILKHATNTDLLFLAEKIKRHGEYSLLKTKDLNVHVMNKFSLERIIDGEVEDV